MVIGQATIGILTRALAERLRGGGILGRKMKLGGKKRVKEGKRVLKTGKARKEKVRKGRAIVYLG